MNGQEGESPRKFLVLLSRGLDTPQFARSALMFATLAAATGLDTILYCAQDGVEALTRGASEKDVVAPGLPTLAQRLAEALEAGVRVQACSQSMANRKLSQDDLIPGAEIAGGAVLIDHALESAGTLAF